MSTSISGGDARARVEFADTRRRDELLAGLAQGTPRVAAVGRSIDELERMNGQRLITSRNVAPVDEARA